jgi:hypothetical protein
VPRPHRRIDKSAARFVSSLAIEYPWCVDWDEYRAMAPQRDPPELQRDRKPSARKPTRSTEADRSVIGVNERIDRF